MNSVIAEVDFSFLDENVQSELFNKISNSADFNDSNVLKEITTGNGKIVMFIFFKRTVKIKYTTYLTCLDDSNKDKDAMINVNSININPGNSVQNRILDNLKKPGTDVENKGKIVS